jgi:hypothetical protein
MTRQYGHYWLIIDYDYFAMITAIAIFATSHAITPPLRRAFSLPAIGWLMTRHYFIDFPPFSPLLIRHYAAIIGWLVSDAITLFSLILPLIRSLILSFSLIH